MSNPTEISLVPECSWQEVGIVPEEVLASETPIVMRGFVNHWPAVSSATESGKALSTYLSRFDTGRPVTVYMSDSRNIGYNKDYSGYNFDRETLTLEAVFNKLSDGFNRTLYVGSTKVDAWLPRFREENDIQIGEHNALVSFWLGSQAKVAAHYDCSANVACCVAGERIFTLFPPEQVGNLYVGPLELTPSGRSISLVDFDDPDHARFPRFKDALAHAQVVRLAPGDALFVPPLWWHHVTSTHQMNLLVNYWWKTSPSYRGNPELALEHAILALRALPEKQKQAWKGLFDYYVFGDNESAVQHIPPHIQGMLDVADEKAARRAWLNLAKKLFT